MRTPRLLYASSFVQPFVRFSFIILAKFLVVVDIFFIQNKISLLYIWFSLFWLYTEVQKSQPSLSLGFTSLSYRVGWIRAVSILSVLLSYWPKLNTLERHPNMQLSQHGPISREIKNIQTIVTLWNGYSRK